jgi:putative membrane protein insertion efficiency factor
VASRLSALMVGVLSLPIHLYRALISPWLPRACRYEPSCSVYALEALRTHGPVRGLWLAGQRLSRCHPWGGFGPDPVPPRQAGGR